MATRCHLRGQPGEMTSLPLELVLFEIDVPTQQLEQRHLWAEMIVGTCGVWSMADVGVQAARWRTSAF